MLNNFLASLPFMTETRADMLISAFWPMVKAGFAVSLPLAIASFVIGMIIAVAGANHALRQHFPKMLAEAG